jgi:hypothetical protein
MEPGDENRSPKSRFAPIAQQTVTSALIVDLERWPFGHCRVTLVVIWKWVELESKTHRVSIKFEIAGVIFFGQRPGIPISPRNCTGSTGNLSGSVAERAELRDIVRVRLIRSNAHEGDRSRLNDNARTDMREAV